MITDPRALRVLCFGDSNTHGATADGSEGGRLASSLRWPGRLQDLLGDGYDVLEEGLNGRTTDLDYGDRPGCNGRSYFLPCLLSHQPLDAVVVMLGTNDLKSCFDRDAATIADALSGFVKDVRDVAADRQRALPMTVLVSPIRIDDTAGLYQDITADAFDPVGVERSRELGHEIRRVAAEHDVEYLDAAQVARAGDDGLHLTVGSHARLAELVKDAIGHMPRGGHHEVTEPTGAADHHG